MTVPRYTDEQVIEALIAIARKRGIDIVTDEKFRKAAALTVLANRGLTIGSMQRKI